MCVHLIFTDRASSAWRGLITSRISNLASASGKQSVRTAAARWSGRCWRSTCRLCARVQVCCVQMHACLGTSSVAPLWTHTCTPAPSSRCRASAPLDPLVAIARRSPAERRCPSMRRIVIIASCCAHGVSAKEMRHRSKPRICTCIGRRARNTRRSATDAQVRLRWADWTSMKERRAPRCR